MTTTTPPIETIGLTKSYGRRAPALADLSLRVEPGEIFGYLGPNGAGKTTTIRLLLDLIRPTGGTARLFGLDAQRDSLTIRRRVGYLSGELNLWNDKTGAGIIDYAARVRGLTAADRRHAAHLAERLSFDTSKKLRTYSTGNKRKLGIIVAMMHRPELLILDEPTSGLDPLVQQTFHDMVLAAREAGATVFLSSHVLSEVQAICDRVAVLRGGTLITTQRVEELMRAGFRWVTLRARGGLPTTIANVPGVSDFTTEGETARLKLSGDFDPLLRALGGVYVHDLHVEEPSLEDIFLTFYADAGAPASSAPALMER